MEPADNKVSKLFNVFKSTSGERFDINKISGENDFSNLIKKLSEEFPKCYSDFTDLVYKLGVKYYCESYRNGRIDNSTAKDFFDGLEKVRSTQKDIVTVLENIYRNRMNPELSVRLFSDYVKLINDTYINIGVFYKDGIVSLNLKSDSNLNQLKNFVLFCLWLSEFSLFKNVAENLNIDINNNNIKNPKFLRSLMDILTCIPYSIRKFERNCGNVLSDHFRSESERDAEKKLKEIADSISNLDLVPIICCEIINKFGVDILKKDKLERIDDNIKNIKDKIQTLINDFKTRDPKVNRLYKDETAERITNLLKSFSDILKGISFNPKKDSSICCDFDPILLYCIMK